MAVAGHGRGQRKWHWGWLVSALSISLLRLWWRSTTSSRLINTTSLHHRLYLDFRHHAVTTAECHCPAASTDTNTTTPHQPSPPYQPSRFDLLLDMDQSICAWLPLEGACISIWRSDLACLILPCKHNLNRYVNAAYTGWKTKWECTNNPKVAWINGQRKRFFFFAF